MTTTTSPHLASDTASDLQMIYGSLPNDASADAFMEFLDTVNAILVPNPSIETVKALQFAIGIMRSEH